MAKQEIDGNNNLQVGHVGGDLTIGQGAQLDPANPNLIECPSCSELASRYARPCPRCGYDIVGHFAALALEKRRKRVMKIAASFGAALLVFGMLMNASWLPSSLRNVVSVLTFLAMLGTAASISVMDKLR